MIPQNSVGSRQKERLVRGAAHSTTRGVAEVEGERHAARLDIVDAVAQRARVGWASCRVRAMVPRALPISRVLPRSMRCLTSRKSSGPPAMRVSRMSTVMWISCEARTPQEHVCNLFAYHLEWAGKPARCQMRIWLEQRRWHSSGFQSQCGRHLNRGTSSFSLAF